MEKRKEGGGAVRVIGLKLARRKRCIVNKSAVLTFGRGDPYFIVNKRGLTQQQLQTLLVAMSRGALLCDIQKSVQGSYKGTFGDLDS